MLAGAALGMSAQTHKEGVEYFKADRYNNAKELLERNYNNPNTDKAVANYYLGELALLEKNPAQAKAYFEKGIEINPDYAYNYIGLGQLALAGGDKDSAKLAANEFKTAESKGKKDAAVQIAIARAYW